LTIAIVLGPDFLNLLLPHRQCKGVRHRSAARRRIEGHAVHSIRMNLAAVENPILTIVRQIARHHALMASSLTAKEAETLKDLCVKLFRGL